MSTDAASVKPGLGTSIVKALSAQLHGIIKVSEVHPGTAVYVTHTQLAVVANDAIPADRAV
jgi:two-component system, sensor histidine kinase PdtaS